MYEMDYDLNEYELQEAQAILGRFHAASNRHWVQKGNRREQVSHIRLSSRRFVVGPRGKVWRYFPHDTPRMTQGLHGGGAWRRTSCIEMWTGNWRKIEDKGKTLYAKCLRYAPIEAHTNKSPNTDHFTWYETKKGWKHPLDSPVAPSQAEIDALENQEQATRGAVLARMEEEGLRTPEQINDLQGLSYRELQTKAKTMGIQGNQKKQELVQAILAHETPIAPPEAVPQTPPSGGPQMGLSAVSAPPRTNQR